MVLTTIELGRILAFLGALLMFPPFTSVAIASGRSINRPAPLRQCVPFVHVFEVFTS